LSLASADFNADGYADLVSGYRSGREGRVTVFLADQRAFEPVDPQVLNGIRQGRYPEPFRESPVTLRVPASADMLAAGDANRDGKPDLLAGARGDRNLYLFAGDGTGQFAEARQVAMPGEVVAMVRDDNATIVAWRSGLTFTVGSFEDITAAPLRTVEVPAEPQSIIAAPLQDADAHDIVVVAGGKLFDIDTRSWQLRPIALPYEVTAIAAG